MAHAEAINPMMRKNLALVATGGQYRIFVRKEINAHHVRSVLISIMSSGVRIAGTKNIAGTQ